MEDSALKMPLQNDGALDWKRNRNYMHGSHDTRIFNVCFIVGGTAKTRPLFFLTTNKIRKITTVKLKIDSQKK